MFASIQWQIHRHACGASATVDPYFLSDDMDSVIRSHSILITTARVSSGRPSPPPRLTRLHAEQQAAGLPNSRLAMPSSCHHKQHHTSRASWQRVKMRTPPPQLWHQQTCLTMHTWRLAHIHLPIKQCFSSLQCEPASEYHQHYVQYPGSGAQEEYPSIAAQPPHKQSPVTCFKQTAGGIHTKLSSFFCSHLSKASKSYMLDPINIPDATQRLHQPELSVHATQCKCCTIRKCMK